jgi:hypothetical protein
MMTQQKLDAKQLGSSKSVEEKQLLSADLPTIRISDSAASLEIFKNGLVAEKTPSVSSILAMNPLSPTEKGTEFGQARLAFGSLVKDGGAIIIADHELLAATEVDVSSVVDDYFGDAFAKDYSSDGGHKMDNALTIADPNCGPAEQLSQHYEASPIRDSEIAKDPSLTRPFTTEVKLIASNPQTAYTSPPMHRATLDTIAASSTAVSEMTSRPLDLAKDEPWSSPEPIILGTTIFNGTPANGSTSSSKAVNSKSSSNGLAGSQTGSPSESVHVNSPPTTTVGRLTRIQRRSCSWSATIPE